MENLVGEYRDPLHGQCLRTIVCVDGRLLIMGIYNADELAHADCEKFVGKPWVTGMSWEPQLGFRVSFAGKRNGHNPDAPHAQLDATFDGNCLHWSDGNTWTHVP